MRPLDVFEHRDVPQARPDQQVRNGHAVFRATWAQCDLAVERLLWEGYQRPGKERETNPFLRFKIRD